MFVMLAILAMVVFVSGVAMACDGGDCGSNGTAGYFNTSTSSSNAFGNFNGTVYAGSHGGCQGGACGGYFGSLNGVALSSVNCGNLAFGTAAAGWGNSATVSGGYSQKSGASYSDCQTGLSMHNESNQWATGTSTTGYQH